MKRAPGDRLTCRPALYASLTRPHTHTTGTLPTLLLVSHLSDIASSDESDNEELESTPEERPEQWPPLYYDSAAPVALPLGPRAVATQEHLAQKVSPPSSPAPPALTLTQAVFADAQDDAATEREQSSIFLLQLPSSIVSVASSLHARLTPTHSYACRVKASSPPAVDAAAAEVSCEQPPLEPGRIGKILVMRSGAMVLQLENGRRYQMHSGLPTSFAQFLVANEVSDHGPRVKQETKKKQPQGAMHMLGNITQKIVVTDSFA